MFKLNGMQSKHFPIKAECQYNPRFKSVMKLAIKWRSLNLKTTDE